MGPRPAQIESHVRASCLLSPPLPASSGGMAIMPPAVLASSAPLQAPAERGSRDCRDAPNATTSNPCLRSMLPWECLLRRSKHDRAREPLLWRLGSLRPRPSRRLDSRARSSAMQYGSSSAASASGSRRTACASSRRSSRRLRRTRLWISWQSCSAAGGACTARAIATRPPGHDERRDRDVATTRSRARWRRGERRTRQQRPPGCRLAAAPMSETHTRAGRPSPAVLARHRPRNPRKAGRCARSAGCSWDDKSGAPPAIVVGLRFAWPRA